MPIPEKYYKSARQDPRLSQCLHCGYDLSGSPEGRCPECGRAFTFAEIRAAFTRRGDRLRLGHNAARGLIAVQCLLLLPILFARSRSDIELATFACGLLCALSLLWFALRLREVLHTRTHERVWLVLPVAALGTVALAQNGSGYAAALLTPMLLLVPRLLCPNADRAKVWLRLSVVACVVCAPLALVMWTSVLRNQTWTDWPDFRPGQVHRQYPLRKDELSWVFGILAVYSSVAMISLLWRIAAWSDQRKKRALKCPPHPDDDLRTPTPG